MELLIICVTVVALYAISKYYHYINPYVEEVQEKGFISDRGKNVGHWRFIKRTYKNGKVIFEQRNYT